MLSNTLVEGLNLENTKLIETGSISIFHKSLITTPDEVLTMPEKCALVGVNDAAVTISDCSTLNTLILHSASTLDVGEIHDKTPKIEGKAVSPSGKYAALIESVCPVVVATVLRFFVQTWSAY